MFNCKCPGVVEIFSSTWVLWGGILSLLPLWSLCFLAIVGARPLRVVLIHMRSVVVYECNPCLDTFCACTFVDFLSKEFSCNDGFVVCFVFSLYLFGSWLLFTFRGSQAFSLLAMTLARFNLMRLGASSFGVVVERTYSLLVSKHASLELTRHCCNIVQWRSSLVHGLFI